MILRNVLFVAFVLSTVNSWAYTTHKTDMDAKKHYYGNELNALLSISGDNSENIKAQIKAVLRGGHIKTNSFDKIIAKCDGTAGCYEHSEVGYNGARVFLLGNYYLSSQGNSYYVRDVYCEHQYGGSDFGSKDNPGPNLIPDHTIVNIEHTWPQSRFSKNFPNEMQKSDMHHLFPSDSKVNSTRGSFKFGTVAEDKQTISCSDARFGYPLDSRELVFQPPKAHKGNVARALFYFSVKYDLKISAEEEKELRKWDQEDPVDSDEINRNQAIFEEQNSRNPFIDMPGLAKRISDF